MQVRTLSVVTLLVTVLMHGCDDSKTGLSTDEPKDVDPDSLPVKVLILTHPFLMDAAAEWRLAYARHSIGATIITTADATDEEADLPVLEACPGASANPIHWDRTLAARIRALIARKISELPTITHLTIIGDATFVPPSYYYEDYDDCFGDDSTSAGEEPSFKEFVDWPLFEDSELPTDVLYAAPRDATEVLLATGRVPCTTTTECLSYLQVVKGTLAARESSSIPTKAVGMSREDDRVEDSMVKGLIYLFQDSAFEALDSTVLTFTDGHEMEKAFYEVMEEPDLYLFVYHYHGRVQGLRMYEFDDDHPDVFPGPSVYENFTISSTPLFLLVACDTGIYDTEVYDEHPPGTTKSFAEYLLFKDDGQAMAVVAAARSLHGALVSQVNPDTPPEDDYDLAVTFLERYITLMARGFAGTTGARTVGEAYRDAMRWAITIAFDYFDPWESYRQDDGLGLAPEMMLVRRLALTFMLFGDPMVPVVGFSH